jgi:aryl-alcohol dehydrogenase-like predicted oxidoreductase
MTPDELLHRPIRALGGKTVHRLGLACNYGIDPRGFSAALERGVSYVFWTPFRTGAITPLLRDALRQDREKLVVASGPTLGWFGGSLRRGTEKLLRRLGTDYLDVLQLFWLGVTSALTEATQEALAQLKEEGKIRATGASIHDRERAGRLAAEGPLDLLMIRYNAAHPGAEQDIFPHLAARQPAVVAYTATAWRKLLRRPKGWDGPVMTAGDCYRFCLSRPEVDVTLTGPGSEAQLAENLDALEKGPLTPDEEAWMRRFGAAVHG